MSYSRFARTWPGGSPSWYIYHDVDGGLAIHQPRDGDRLSREDVKYLAEILLRAYEDMEGDDYRMYPPGTEREGDRIDRQLREMMDSDG